MEGSTVLTFNHTHTHMHTDTHTDTSGFDLPATNVLELMIFAAISWCTTLPAPVVTFYVARG